MPTARLSSKGSSADYERVCWVWGPRAWSRLFWSATRVEGAAVQRGRHLEQVVARVPQEIRLEHISIDFSNYSLRSRVPRAFSDILTHNSPGRKYFFIIAVARNIHKRYSAPCPADVTSGPELIGQAAPFESHLQGRDRRVTTCCIQAPSIQRLGCHGGHVRTRNKDLMRQRWSN